jgi:hypothetical protein
MATLTPPAPKSFASLDQRRNLRSSEQPLDLSLLGGVAFLYLGGARLKRGNIVAFGGAGGSTAAVTACPSPDQDDHITFHGSLSSHESLSSRTDDKAELKVLGDKVLVIDLLDKTGGNDQPGFHKKLYPRPSVGAIPRWGSFPYRVSEMGHEGLALPLIRQLPDYTYDGRNRGSANSLRRYSGCSSRTVSISFG